MHVHSVHSDGVWSPMQLAELARRTGLAGFVLTDHDTVPSQSVLAEVGRRFDVEVYCGVELSTEFVGRGLHLLGYGFDPLDADLLAMCSELQAKRRERWWRMVESLRQKKIKLDDARMARIAALATPGRLHMARELVRLRQVSGVRAAFARYLNDIEVQRREASVLIEKAIATLHAAGGRAVLAHPPPKLTKESWDRLADFGLDGVEINHPSLSTTHRRFLRMVAEQRGWLVSAGSDYHGDEPGEGLGTFTLTEEEFSVFYPSRLVEPKVQPVPA